MVRGNGTAWVSRKGSGVEAPEAGRAAEGPGGVWRARGDGLGDTAASVLVLCLFRHLAFLQCWRWRYLRGKGEMRYLGCYNEQGENFLQAPAQSERGTAGNFLFGCRNACCSGSGTLLTLERASHSPSWLTAVWQKAPSDSEGRRFGLGMGMGCQHPFAGRWCNVSPARPEPPAGPTLVG